MFPCLKRPGIRLLTLICYRQLAMFIYHHGTSQIRSKLLGLGSYNMTYSWEIVVLNLQSVGTGRIGFHRVRFQTQNSVSLLTLTEFQEE